MRRLTLNHFWSIGQFIISISARLLSFGQPWPNFFYLKFSLQFNNLWCQNFTAQRVVSVNKIKYCKKQRWLAWDSNPGPQEFKVRRRRRIHRAVVAPFKPVSMLPQGDAKAHLIDMWDQDKAFVELYIIEKYITQSGCFTKIIFA